MLSFKELTLEDIPRIREYFEKYPSRQCDNTIGAAFMWREYFKTSYAIYKDTVVFKADYLDEHTAFTVPIGQNRIQLLQLLKEHCQKNDIPLILCTVVNEDFELIEKVFPKYNKTLNRDWSDYIYNLSDLATFKGKKFNGQRNHINKFKSLYPDYRFVEITKENIPEIKSFLESFLQQRQLDDTEKEEGKAVTEVLDNFDTYKMKGYALKVGEKIVSFSMGEVVGDTLFVHIEKADLNYKGAYQMTVKEFACRFEDKAQFINREEDLGDEGLRKSKLSYQPCEILDKYTLQIL